MKKILAIAIAAVIGLLAPNNLFAQSHIEKVINKVSTSNTSREEVFSERRNPATGKVVRISRIFTLSNVDAKSLLKAFDEDRSKSISYEFVRNEVYSIKFRTKDGGSATYQLIRDGRSWTFTVDIRPKSGCGSNTSFNILPEELLENIDELDCFSDSDYLKINI